jgi:hypothetical protein
MKAALSILALSALVACGGGGGGSGGGFLPVAPAPATTVAQEESAPAVHAEETPILKVYPVNPGCTMAAPNHMACELISHEQTIGVGVPPGVYVTFTNNTGMHLQINEINAETGERQFWSEHCIYLNVPMTGQNTAGQGEVGCSSKQIGKDYPPIRFGQGNGLAVAPGDVVYLASHTHPSAINHTFALNVQVQTTGLMAWRMPQIDAVNSCDGQQQSTVWGAWTNTTSTNLHLTGASIYSEAGAGSHTLNGSACIFVMDASGATKYTNCDAALKTRGEVKFPVVTIAPGESVAAQGVNSCSAPNLWGWAAFLQVW